MDGDSAGRSLHRRHGVVIAGVGDGSADSGAVGRRVGEGPITEGLADRACIRKGHFLQRERDDLEDDLAGLHLGDIVLCAAVRHELPPQLYGGADSVKAAAGRRLETGIGKPGYHAFDDVFANLGCG